MKKYLFYLLAGVVACTLLGCGKDSATDEPTDWLQTPVVTRVEATRVSLACTANVNTEVVQTSVAGFSYAVVDETGSPGVWRHVAARVNGRNLSATIEGLTPATRYQAKATLTLAGQQHSSPLLSFQTEAAGETPQPDPELEILDSDLTLGFEEDLYTITYMVYHPQTGVQVEARSSAPWIHSFDYRVWGEVTFAADTNMGAERSATLTLTYGNAEPQSIRIVQRAYEDRTEPQPEVEPTFGTLTVSNITANSATVSGSIAYTGSESLTALYFVYTDASASKRADVTPSFGSKNLNLTGLTASTPYTVRLFATLGGKSYSSSPVTFTTSAAATQTGNTMFSGWPELPTTIEKAGEWYYTYHLTDQTAGGHAARNYAVCYSREKMCAIWVAAPMHPFYAEKNSSRSEAYKNDPNIPFSQPGKWTGYTRGHLLGSAERLVSRKTNEQVFYYSNIAPQLQTYFNTGGGAWNTLEDWVDTQWADYSDTTYQVIGCYWDPKQSPKVVDDTTIPTHFYKVLLRTKGHKNKFVKDCSRDELQCIAIMIEHRTYSKSEVPKTSQYQSLGLLHTVSEMEQLTGLTFFGNVPNAPKDTYNLSDWGF